MVGGAGDATQWPSSYIAWPYPEKGGSVGLSHYVSSALVKRGQIRRQEAVRIKKMEERNICF